MAEIGCTGHFPYPQSYQEPYPHCVIPESIFPKFVDEVLQLKAYYKDAITIRVAAEIDYLPGYMEEIKSRLIKYPLDYVIGSIHMLEDIPIDYNNEILKTGLERFGGVDEMWKRYWDAMESLIKADICDVIGHFDLPRKLRSGQTDTDFSGEIETLLRMIKAKDLSLDVNTGGIDRSYAKSAYPSNDIIQKALDLGIDIVLGSDAHAPEQVGRYFDELSDALVQMGWSHVPVYEGRTKRLRRIVEAV